MASYRELQAARNRLTSLVAYSLGAVDFSCTAMLILTAYKYDALRDPDVLLLLIFAMSSGMLFFVGLMMFMYGVTCAYGRRPLHEDMHIPVGIALMLVPAMIAVSGIVTLLLRHA